MWWPQKIYIRLHDPEWQASTEPVVRKDHSWKDLESGFNISLDQEKKNCQQEGLIQQELGMPDRLREYGRNLLMLNIWGGKTAPHKPGQATEPSLCGSQPSEISASSDVIHGFKKKSLWDTGWKLHYKSKNRNGSLGYSIVSQREIMSGPSCESKTDGEGVIEGWGWRVDHTSGWIVYSM